MADVLTNLSVNQQDDMEITSEAGQADADFDIDFEPTADSSGFHHEDEMLDDTPITYDQEDIELRSATDNNDYMIDDVSFERGPNQQDGLMLDDAAQSTVDEELLDLSEDETPAKPDGVGQEHGDDAHAYLVTEERLEDWTGNEVVEETEIAIANVAELESQVPPVAASSYQDNITEIAGSSIATEQAHDEPGNDLIEQDLKTFKHDESLSNLQGSKESVAEASTTSVLRETDPALADEVQSAIQETTSDAGNHDLNDPEDGHGHHDAQSRDQVATPHSEHSEDRPTLTGLHPTVVQYDGGQYTLFPSSEPSEGEEYFLEDENLVNSSIGDLLQACRAVLGEAITEDSELELQVDDLELFIGEDSKAAFSTSWSELLDLFLQLHHNDGTDHPPPMMVSLITKSRFANRLTLLSNTAAEGKGISQIPTVYGLHEVDEEGVYAHDATEYLDAAEIQDNLEMTKTFTDAQKIVNDLDKSVVNTSGNPGAGVEDEYRGGATLEVDIPHSKDALAELDYPDPLADQSSHTISRDEAEEIYLQDDDSQPDQLYNLVGDVHDDEAENALQYDGIEDEFGDDDQSSLEKVQGIADTTSSAGLENAAGISELKGGVRGTSHSPSQAQADLISTELVASKEDSEASRGGSDLASTLPRSASHGAAPEAGTLDDEDEIDFEDELDNEHTEDGNASNVSEADGNTSRVRTKRSLDEVDDEEDSEAKRHRPL